MTVSIHTISGGPQTGKTTIAVGALEMLHRQGVPVLYVTVSQDHARNIKQRRCLVIPCIGQGVLYHNLDTRVFLDARAFAFDDVDYWTPGHFKPLFDAAVNCLKAHIGPTQIIVVRG